MTDPLNRSSRWQYDAFGRIIVREEQGLYTEYGYQDDKGVLEVMTAGVMTQRIVTDALGQCLSVIDARGYERHYRYDARGAVTEVTGPEGVETRCRYDAANRVLRRTQDPEGLSLTTAYQYDGLGRLTQETAPDGVESRFYYDRAGHLLKRVEDPEGLAITRCYRYDDAGRVVEERLLNPGGEDQVTAFAYDASDRLIAQTEDPEGLSLTTRYRWDGEGRLIESTDPRGFSRHFIYDASGQCRFSIDARGVVTAHRYTSAGREWQTVVYANPISALAVYDEAHVAAALQTDDSKDRYTTRYFDQDLRKTHLN